MVAELSRANVVRVALVGRLFGLGGVFGKTVRDSRLAVVVVAGLLSQLLLVFGKFFAAAYPDAEARGQLTDLVASLPSALKGLTYGSGDPVKLDTLGGYISQDPGLLLKLIPGLWSILALSVTLAAEARRGSLDFVAVTPVSRRRIATQKLTAHATAMTVVVAVVAVAAWLTGQAFARLPGDAISPGAAIGYAIWLGLTGLAAGSIAFALAPWLGRAAAAAVAGAVMFGGYIVNGYQASFPNFSKVANLTWFSWTADHNPLAGEYDWQSLALVAAVTVVFFAAGVEAFARRDLGPEERIAVRIPGRPDATLGLRGPVGRSLAEFLPAALGWGAGIGIYGLLIAASSRSFADQLGKTPDIAAKLRSLFPTYDITTTGGVLQAAFMMFGFILACLAAATLVRIWASDETAGRLELLLSSPSTRARWAIASGLAVYVAIAVVTLVTAMGIGDRRGGRRRRRCRPRRRDTHPRRLRGRPGRGWPRRGWAHPPSARRHRGRRAGDRDLPGGRARRAAQAARVDPPPCPDHPPGAAHGRNVELGWDCGQPGPRTRRSGTRRLGDATSRPFALGPATELP